MGIRADDEFSRQGESLFREYLVADALPDIKEIGYPLLFCPLPDIILKLGCCLVIGRCDVVKGYYYPVWVPYLFYAHLPEGLYRKHACPVMRHGVIYIGYYKIVCFRGFT